MSDERFWFEQNGETLDFEIRQQGELVATTSLARWGELLTEYLNTLDMRPLSGSDAEGQG